jgi:CubicO group peptidase (beta-lactamase class C family)
MNWFKNSTIFFIWWAVANATAFYFFYHQTEDNSALKLKKSGEFHEIYSITNEQVLKFQEIFRKLHLNQGFNGVVLVGQKDSVFYQESFGWSNYKSRDSMTLNSSFQLASISKQFTAVAILQLYEKGILKLTDSIEKFYPTFPHKGITMHQLLTHRSGLPNYHYFLQDISSRTDTLISCQYIVQEIIAQNIPLYFNPNRRYQYSNTGYAVLAAIVEKVSGLPFEVYVEKELLNPLEMNHSFVYRGNGSLKKGGATTGYVGRWRESYDNHLDGVLGDKGIYCNANDLFKWDQGLHKGIVINYDTLQLAFEPMGKPLISRSNYGYGWRILNWHNNSFKVVYHGGWWHGYKTLLISIPKDRISIIVLKNLSISSKVNTNELLNIFYATDSTAVADSLDIEANDN